VLVVVLLLFVIIMVLNSRIGTQRTHHRVSNIKIRGEKREKEKKNPSSHVVQQWCFFFLWLRALDLEKLALCAIPMGCRKDPSKKCKYEEWGMSNRWVRGQGPYYYSSYDYYYY